MGTLASGSIDLKSLKVAGEGANKYITEISDGGISVHDASSNSNYVAITSSGMEVYSGINSSTQVAEFKSYINIGTGHTNTYTGSAAIGVGLTTTKTNQIIIGRYNENNSNATFIIGDGTSSSDKSNLLTVGNIAGKQIIDTFIGDGSTKTFTLSNTPVSTPTVIPDVSSTTTYTISSWSDTTVTLNTNVVENERIQFQYTTNEKGGYLIVGNANGIHGKGAIIGGVFDDNSTMTASGRGASIHGYASNSTIITSGVGASIHERAYALSTITASGAGASIHGYASSNSTITASDAGASIHGYAAHSTMTASDSGASIHGYAYSNGTMIASDHGASIHGQAYYNSTMTASGVGASIHGSAYSNGTMIASGTGALIHGFAYSNSTMTASGPGSVALNEATHALKRAQVAIGSFNADDSATTTTHPSNSVNYGTYAFIIGNGVDEDNRSNAMAVDWSGQLTINSIRFDTTNKRPPFTTFTATGSGTLSSSGGAIACTGTVPTGYTPIAVQEISTNHNYTAMIGRFQLNSNGVSVSFGNRGSGTLSVDVTAVVLCTCIQ